MAKRTDICAQFLTCFGANNVPFVAGVAPDNASPTK